MGLPTFQSASCSVRVVSPRLTLVPNEVAPSYQVRTSTERSGVVAQETPTVSIRATKLRMVAPGLVAYVYRVHWSSAAIVTSPSLSTWDTRPVRSARNVFVVLVVRQPRPASSAVLAMVTAVLTTLAPSVTPSRFCDAVGPNWYGSFIVLSTTVVVVPR